MGGGSRQHRFVTMHRSEVSRLPNLGGRWSIRPPTQSRAELQIRRRRMGQDVRSPRGPRCIALVGPFQSGKTTLLEAILARTGAIKNAGSVDAGTSVGDASPEARRHKMGVGLSAATTTFMGDSYTFIDLALERAFVYREHKPSEVVALEGGNLDREKEARFSMLEKLADHDDALMEQLLEDIPPPRDAVFDDLARELREGLICPVLLGAALRENGVLRLMKALRHESPGVAETAKRLGASSPKDALAYVFKTVHLQHGGKLSLARVLTARLDDGATLQSSSGESGRVSGILAVSCAHDSKRAAAEAGETIALGKLDTVKTGDTISGGKTAPKALVRVEPSPPVLALALAATDRKDD